MQISPRPAYEPIVLPRIFDDKLGPYGEENHAIFAHRLFARQTSPVKRRHTYAINKATL